MLVAPGSLPSPRTSRFPRAKAEVAGAPPCSFSSFFNANNCDNFSRGAKSHAFISEAWKTGKAQRKWSPVLTPEVPTVGVASGSCALGCGGRSFLILQVVTAFREFILRANSSD